MAHKHDYPGRSEWHAPSNHNYPGKSEWDGPDVDLNGRPRTKNKDNGPHNPPGFSVGHYKEETYDEKRAKLVDFSKGKDAFKDPKKTIKSLYHLRNNGGTSHIEEAARNLDKSGFFKKHADDFIKDNAGKDCPHFILSVLLEAPEWSENNVETLNSLKVKTSKKGYSIGWDHQEKLERLNEKYAKPVQESNSSDEIKSEEDTSKKGIKDLLADKKLLRQEPEQVVEIISREDVSLDGLKPEILKATKSMLASAGNTDTCLEFLAVASSKIGKIEGATDLLFDSASVKKNGENNLVAGQLRRALCETQDIEEKKVAAAPLMKLFLEDSSNKKITNALEDMMTSGTKRENIEIRKQMCHELKSMTKQTGGKDPAYAKLEAIVEKKSTADKVQAFFQNLWQNKQR